MDFGIAGVAAITVICYLLGWIARAAGLADRWIPILVGACGGALGIAAMFTMPGYPANDPVTAVAVGIVSGLAATGLRQTVKQRKKEAK